MVAITTRLHPRPPGRDERLARRMPPATPALASATRDMLGLQQQAGNHAVGQALAGDARAPVVVQRQPKPPPQWVLDAQAELGVMYGKDPLLSKVVIKDYGELNATLQQAAFGAWTQSKLEIYVKNYSGEADPNDPTTAKWPLYMMRYILRHEAEHVRQFSTASGPPATWLQMLKYERTAYGNDVTWLSGSEGKRLIPDARLRRRLLGGAQQNLRDIKGIIAAAAKKKRADREAARRQGMIDKSLIPASAPSTPTPLYQQGP